MHYISSVKNSSLALLCLGLFVVTLLSTGCSKPEKETPKAEKKVVTEMNIQASSEPEKQAPKKDEVESLPFETDDAKEEEDLPILGSDR